MARRKRFWKSDNGPPHKKKPPVSDLARGLHDEGQNSTFKHSKIIASNPKRQTRRELLIAEANRFFVRLARRASNELALKVFEVPNDHG